jgi:hypothetical protein
MLINEVPIKIGLIRTYGREGATRPNKWVLERLRDTVAHRG